MEDHWIGPKDFQHNRKKKQQQNSTLNPINFFQKIVEIP